MKENGEKGQGTALNLDWLIGGVLTKVGDTFDRITGRKWNPSSSLATSRLEEKLRKILDSEARQTDAGTLFAPHVFRLKVQWNKFSTDSELELRKLEHVLHAAAIDHINDRLYHTFAPIEVTVVKDYFVEGVQFIASFGEFSESGDDETAINVTLTNIPTGSSLTGAHTAEPEAAVPEQPAPEVRLAFELRGKASSNLLRFDDQKRYSVGRAGANDVVIDDQSVSKTHAAIALSKDGAVIIADTGSTNGTFIDGVRMVYGKSRELTGVASLIFGDVEVRAEVRSVAGHDEPEPTQSIPYTPPATEPAAHVEPAVTEVLETDEDRET